MIGQQRGRAFALGTGNADDLRRIDPQEQIRLRTQQGRGQQIRIILQRNPRRLHHDAESPRTHLGRKIFQIGIAGQKTHRLVIGQTRFTPHRLVAVYHPYLFRWQQLPNKTISTLPFPAKTQDSHRSRFLEKRPESLADRIRQRIPNQMPGFRSRILPQLNLSHRLPQFRQQVYRHIVLRRKFLQQGIRIPGRNSRTQLVISSGIFALRNAEIIPQQRIFRSVRPKLPQAPVHLVHRPHALERLDRRLAAKLVQEAMQIPIIQQVLPENPARFPYT